MRFLPLLLVAFASVSAAQNAATLTETVDGVTATIQLVADPPNPAAEAGFEALRTTLGDGHSTGTACDAALAALRAAGAPQAIVVFRGAAAAGEPPPGAPGWMMRMGFGTAGHASALWPLARAGYAGAAPEGEPLKVGVLAGDAASAEELAREAQRLGRRAGRALIEGTEGARLFLEDARFRPLFDGRSLDGWTSVGGRYDGEAIWAAERGAIVGRTGPAGEGGLLYTEREYTSFVVELETQIDYPFDSGVFVHMRPRAEGNLKGAQVTLDFRDGGEIAGIYSDGWLHHNPDVKERFRADEWNHVEVRCTGFEPRIEVWLNGEKVTDYQLPPDAEGFASSGKIGVQVHGGNPGEKRARFRNVRIRELPVFGDPDVERGEWLDLLAGDSLDAWELSGTQEGYTVADGLLTVPPLAAGHLYTREDFRDFRLRLDFKTARMANSGVFLRATRDGENPAYSGCEVQILDDFNWESVTGSTLKPWQFTGSLYGSVPAGDSGLRPLGEWNTYEILYRGKRLAVALNGRLLYDIDTHALTPEAGKPFAERAAEGFLGLQAHSPASAPEGEPSIWFRDVRVQRL
ncbi:MAG: DUF1080 domain-containing protein [Planctomycetota bacterium]